MRQTRLSRLPTLAAMAALTMSSAHAAPTPASAPAKQPQITEQFAPRVAAEPIMAIVSIKSQQITFYDADGWIVRAPVSTGTKGRETPAGIFAVVQKNKDHRSNMYDDAWMPNMQRITWNGIALHGGPLPGYAASHGCVRMPFGFAEKMFDKTRIGMRVIISPNDAVPVDFTHPALFVPNAVAIAAAPARVETLAREADEAARGVDTAKKAVVTAARDATALTAAIGKLGGLKTRAEAQAAAAAKALAGADKALAQAEDTLQKATTAATEATAALDTARAEAASAPTVAVVEAPADPEAKAAADAVAREAAARATALRKLETQKTGADAKVAASTKALAAAEQARAKAEDASRKAAARVADLIAQIDTARPEAKAKADAAAAAKEAAKAAEARKVPAAKAAAAARLDIVPVSVYISRATQKIYVRRNTHKPWPDGGEVFDFSIEMPITIREPERRIGTHIFTAVAPQEAGMRWTAVTIDGSDSAQGALDRITIPKELVDRIAPLVLPRSSIIVSDEPLSAETNYRTEFVAVLSNQPQGGFITRTPTAVVPVASQRNNFGFFPFWQNNPPPRTSNQRWPGQPAPAPYQPRWR